MPSTGVDIKAIKRIMREDLTDAGIEPDVYLDQKSKEEKIFCIHCGTLILDIVNDQGYTPESRLVRCNACGKPMHVDCAIRKGGTSRSAGIWSCVDCIRSYVQPTSGSVFRMSSPAFTISGSVSGLFPRLLKSLPKHGGLHE